jgi:hypothetical protein
MRPIPRGRVSRAEALAFGLVLSACSVAVLGFAVNIGAAALLAFTIFFYVVVYTMWLKRQTPQNIVIGGAAGALPPVIGWVAATGRIGVEPLILFLIIFLWTPPTSGRCRSIVLVNTPAPASQCCRSWLARPQQNGRFSLTASCWCRFRSCPGHSDLREQSTARPRGCPVRRSFCLQCSCTGAMAPKSAPGFTRFTKAVGHRVQIVGDDFLVTDAARLRRAAAMPACNAILVKPNQVGTVSEAMAAVEAARAVHWSAIVSARSGETEDVTIVHLAVGWGVLQLKVGSFSRSERMAKWNEALRIELMDGRARSHRLVGQRHAAGCGQILRREIRLWRW